MPTTGPLCVCDTARPPAKIGPQDADIIWVYDMMDQLGVFPHNASNSSPLIIGDLDVYGIHWANNERLLISVVLKAEEDYTPTGSFMGRKLNMSVRRLLSVGLDAAEPRPFERKAQGPSVGSAERNDGRPAMVVAALESTQFRCREP